MPALLPGAALPPLPTMNDDLAIRFAAVALAKHAAHREEAVR
jgi:hypothetical protein